MSDAEQIAYLEAALRDANKRLEKQTYFAQEFEELVACCRLCSRDIGRVYDGWDDE